MNKDAKNVAEYLGKSRGFSKKIYRGQELGWVARGRRVIDMNRASIFRRAEDFGGTKRRESAGRIEGR